MIEKTLNVWSVNIMFITLLLLAHATAEWVEIKQQHYLKPVKVISNPAFLNAPSKQSQETSNSFETPFDKEVTNAAKPNRIYINHTILHQGWNDEMFTDYSSIPESSTTKFTRKFRPPNSNNNNNLRKQNTLVADKISHKGVKVKEVVRITDKILRNKNSEAKVTASTKKPNRIYIEDEHSGSLEVYELSDLEKLAEEDSEEYLKKHIVLKQTVPANLVENEASAHTVREKYKDHSKERGNKTSNKTKEPYRLLNTDNLRRVDIIKKSDSRHTTESIETESVPDESFAFIKKHMVAKITKVGIPNKTKTSTDKTEMDSQEDEVEKVTKFDKNLQNEVKTTKSDISDTISITTKKSSEIKQNNRYEHHGTKKGEKMPDPEAIMIKEILSENKNYDTDVTSTEKGDKDINGKKVVGDPEYKKHSKTKGQKAPDPDAAMIQELLSEVAKMSHATTTDKKHQVNNKIAIIQTVKDISTRKPSEKLTILTHLKKNKPVLVEKTDMIQNQVSSQESTSAKNKSVTVQLKKKPATIYDDDQSNSETEEDHTTLTNFNNFVVDRKTDKIGKIKRLDLNSDDDLNIHTEETVLTTPKKKTHTSTTEKWSKQYESGHYSYEPVNLHTFTEKVRTEFDSTENPYKPIEIHTSTEKGSIGFDSREYSYKPVIRLHEEKPEFVSKEEFFTESGEIVDLNENYSEPNLEISTIEPVIPRKDNVMELNTVLTRESENNDPTAAKDKEVKHKTKDPKKEEINIKEKKDSTMENVVKLLKIVTDIIARNTRKSFTSKVRYLEGLKDTLLANIEERIEATFPSPTRSARSGQAQAAWSTDPRAAATARGHVDFPSSESALMTISFLTFAVFLIKLVLQVIHTYKSKTAIPSVVAAVGRAAGRWQHRRN